METTNTLKFASRAKFIPAKAKKAELFGGDMPLLVESLRAEVALLRIQLADSEALVGKLQNGSEVDAPYTIHGVLANGTTNDGNVVALQGRVNTLEREKLERDRYINNLQSQVMRLQGLPFQSPSAPVPARRSPPSNFSLPSNHIGQGPTSPPPNLDTSPPLPRFVRPKEESSDELNALADKELITNVLTKSQKSRDEARNLQLQIALLKKREADKLGSGFSGNKENAAVADQRVNLTGHVTAGLGPYRDSQYGFI